MITTIITWVIVLPEGEEGAAAGAAHGDRPGAAGLRDSCDSLYDSLVTAYLVVSHQVIQQLALPRPAVNTF